MSSGTISRSARHLEPQIHFDANRPTSVPLNVFLVILNAEIKFRRYRRMGNMPRLPEDVEELINETVRLVGLIYWEPKTDVPYHQRVESSLPVMDVDIQDTSDVEMRMKPVDEEDDTLGTSSRRTQAVRRHGEIATLEQPRDYMQYLLSGRDFELDSDGDEELLEELGYGPDSFARPNVPGCNTDTLDPVHVAKKVGQWQQAIQVK